VLDHQNQIGVELTNVANAERNGWISGVPRTIDYREAVKVLSNWNRDWAAVSKISDNFDAALNPATMRLLKLGV
jgi:hypothetical protein